VKFCRTSSAENFEAWCKREFVDAVQEEWDVSIRRACRIIETDTLT